VRSEFRGELVALSLDGRAYDYRKQAVAKHGQIPDGLLRNWVARSRHERFHLLDAFVHFRNVGIRAHLTELLFEMV
jgi:transposase-like protein